jgi:hypothetical protein
MVGGLASSRKRSSERGIHRVGLFAQANFLKADSLVNGWRLGLFAQALIGAPGPRGQLPWPAGIGVYLGVPSFWARWKTLPSVLMDGAMMSSVC